VKTTLADLALYEAAIAANALVDSDQAGLFRNGVFADGRPLDDGEGSGYGYGWSLFDRNGASYATHGGSWMGTATYFQRNLTSGVTVIVLANEGVSVDWTRSYNQRSAPEQRLIEMEADTEAAALSVLYAAWLSDMRRPNNLESSVCKAKGGEVCRTIPQAAMELLGGMSGSHDHLVEKFLRDGRISDIYEGTGQIQRLIIAREILGYSSEELS
jgi:hypothetical protein